MQDIAERLEIGVLQFQLVGPHGDRDEVVFTNERYQTPDFGCDNHVEKLVIQEEDCIAESGIIITTQQGQQLVVVANVAPCHITVRGVTDLNTKFDPEYDLDEYRRLKLGEDIADIN